MKEADRDARLKVLLTPQFLEVLSEVARLYGWTGDYVEVRRFVEDVHEEVGLEYPDLEAIEIEYPED